MVPHTVQTYEQGYHGMQSLLSIIVISPPNNAQCLSDTNPSQTSLES